MRVKNIFFYRTLTVLLIAVVVGCASEDEQTTSESTSSPAALSHEESLARGEYLVETVAGCVFCHTSVDATGQFGEPYAGGLEVPEPIGTWRSLNITQDVETGIGGWTDQEIIDAIREGKRPDGSQLYAVMPYTVYNEISDEDAQAMVDYLRTVPAVEKNVERATDHSFPFVPTSQAPGLAPDASNELARGQYLASMMHCVECHTPIGPEGPDHERAFAGGFPFAVAPVPGTGMVWSSNLTAHETGIAHYSKVDLIQLLTAGVKPDGLPVLGPMNIYKDRWAEMTEQDLSDLSAFILSLEPIENHIPPTTFEPAG